MFYCSVLFVITGRKLKWVRNWPVPAAGTRCRRRWPVKRRAARDAGNRPTIRVRRRRPGSRGRRRPHWRTPTTPSSPSPGSPGRTGSRNWSRNLKKKTDTTAAKKNHYGFADSFYRLRATRLSYSKLCKVEHQKKRPTSSELYQLGLHARLNSVTGLGIGRGGGANKLRRTSSRRTNRWEREHHSKFLFTSASGRPLTTNKAELFRLLAVTQCQLLPGTEATYQCELCHQL